MRYAIRYNDGTKILIENNADIAKKEGHDQPQDILGQQVIPSGFSIPNPYTTYLNMSDIVIGMGMEPLPMGGTMGCNMDMDLSILSAEEHEDLKILENRERIQRMQAPQHKYQMGGRRGDDLKGRSAGVGRGRKRAGSDDSGHDPTPVARGGPSHHSSELLQSQWWLEYKSLRPDKLKRSADRLQDISEPDKQNSFQDSVKATKDLSKRFGRKSIKKEEKRFGRKLNKKEEEKRFDRKPNKREEKKSSGRCISDFDSWGTMTPLMPDNDLPARMKTLKNDHRHRQRPQLVSNEAVRKIKIANLIST
ncbi:hypothetical protein P167DRAFT_438820 [Morchella conica CCBAS932]|uniref:Uncharacterized protein n=1 Tax=Morchella conica CCBAS932 TaxID=1392247 RepID=A0A3N4KCC6_9PEZI|nr:hypothetical protein P167DRAFT_438820 [Morchella conica CCBAS932]